MIKRSINLNIEQERYEGIKNYLESIKDDKRIKVERFSKKSEYEVKYNGKCEYLIINKFKNEDIGILTLTNEVSKKGLASDEYEDINEKVQKEVIRIILDYIYNEGKLERGYDLKKGD